MLIEYGTQPHVVHRTRRPSARAYLKPEKGRRHAAGLQVRLARFLRLVRAERIKPLPTTPITVASYLAQLADRRIKASTIQRRVASIRMLSDNRH
jgi:hypothetical protein